MALGPPALLPSPAWLTQNCGSQNPSSPLCAQILEPFTGTPAAPGLLNLPSSSLASPLLAPSPAPQPWLNKSPLFHLCSSPSSSCTLESINPGIPLMGSDHTNVPGQLQPLCQAASPSPSPALGLQLLHFRLPAHPRGNSQVNPSPEPKSCPGPSSGLCAV